MTYLLDTVAVSDSTKVEPDPGLGAFLADSSPGGLYLSSITIGEVRFGVARMPIGRKRTALDGWISDVEARYGGRIIPVDTDVAKVWASLRADTIAQGYTIGLHDLLIAATALHHDLTVITRNVSDFEPTGCKIHNPWHQVS